MEQDDIKVAWSIPELKDYFEDEDINDDHEWSAHRCEEGDAQSSGSGGLYG